MSDLAETRTDGRNLSDAGDHPERATDFLIKLAEDFPGEEMTIGSLVDGMKDRAFGILMLILALPCCLPFLYGVPQVVSVPMLFIAAQIAVGRHTLWLPESLRKRSFSKESFHTLVSRSKRYVGWFEAIARPRLSWLTRGAAERVFGVFMVAFCASIAVPLPGTNTLPGIAVAIMSVGFIERDGLLVILGTILGTLWVGLLAFGGITLIKTLLSFVTG